MFIYLCLDYDIKEAGKKIILLNLKSSSLFREMSFFVLVSFRYYILICLRDEIYIMIIMTNLICILPISVHQSHNKNFIEIKNIKQNTRTKSITFYVWMNEFDFLHNFLQSLWQLFRMPVSTWIELGYQNNFCAEKL